jgi:hypothetical protein
VKRPIIKGYYHQWKGALSSLQVQCLQAKVQSPLEKAGMPHQIIIIIIIMQRSITKRLNVIPHVCKGVLSREPYPQKAQRPPRSVERPLSSGGDSIHESVLATPQYSPKDPSVNQACGYVNPSSEEGLM